jgi:3-hydroxyacyl-CoA dehydrogenase/enoyl-CoA hydratase/3-hydroxybutyryl-CoA epimerase
LPDRGFLEAWLSRKIRSGLAALITSNDGEPGTMALFQTDNLWISQLAEGVAVLHLDVAGRSVNVLSPAVLGELKQALERIEQEATIRLLLIRSGKKGSFIAGADVHEFAKIQTPEQASALSELGQRIFDRLANLRVPTVAIISGACLGGGLELALACDYRVVINDPKTQIGFPEIELGLLPAWGGTQRLPRVVGLERALQMILGTRRVSAVQAVAWGLADHITADEDDGPPDFLGEPVKRPKSKLPLRGLRQKLLEGNFVGRALIYRGAERILRQRLPDDMPAPWEALDAIKTGVNRGIEAGLEIERAAAGRLALSPACRNLVGLFLRREQARQLPERGPGDEPPLRRVGVVGCGAMGAGIVQLAAVRGCDVTVQEENETALGLGMLRVVTLLTQAVEKGMLPAAELEKKMAAVHGSTTWRGFASLDLVIEAIIEDLDKKQDVFTELEKQAAPSTILTSNTSSLKIQQLQKGLKHPGRVAGLHFFNPVHKMPLVEVVGTAATREPVVTALRRFVVELGKVPVLVKDSPGFLVNRVLVPYFNEAVLLVGEGVPIDRVDSAMRHFGMPMGPLEVLDQVGLDVAAHIAGIVQPLFEDRLPPNPGVELMKEKGWLGQKTGQGFYKWQRGRRQVNVFAQRQIATLQGNDEALTAVTEDRTRAARDRLVMLTVNEAAACLGEKLAADADTIDLALVLGAGWAPHRGGPMRYAQSRGWQAVVLQLEDLAKKHGPRFQPCSELLRLAGRG